MTQNGVILESSVENFTVVLVIKVLPKNVWECTSNCRMGKREDGAVMKNICWIKTRAFFCGKIEFVHFSDFKTYGSLFAGLKCLQVAASHLDTVLEKLKDILDSAGKSLLQRCIAESYCNLLLKCLLTVMICLQFAICKGVLHVLLYMYLHVEQVSFIGLPWPSIKICICIFWQ